MSALAELSGGLSKVLAEEIACCDQQVKQHVRTDQSAAPAAQWHGVGELTASALGAALGDMA